MGQNSSTDSFKFAHTSFMVADQKKWHRATIAAIVIAILALILIIILVIVFVVVRPQSSNYQRESSGGVIGGPGPDSAQATGCFPANSTVLTTHGMKTLHQLAIGDYVEDLEEHGIKRYTRVYAWFRRSSQNGLYYILKTETKQQITLSKNHLLIRQTTDHLGGWQFVRADEIQMNDNIIDHEGIWTRVTSVQTSIAEGLYAPVTESGTLFVDNVLVSSYTGYWADGMVGHVFIHRLAMAPMRILLKIHQRFFSFDKKLFQPINNENLWFVEMYKFLDVCMSKISTFTY